MHTNDQRQYYYELWCLQVIIGTLSMNYDVYKSSKATLPWTMNTQMKLDNSTISNDAYQWS